jgi:hypothetical protein
MFPAPVRGTDRCYLAPFAGLKEFAIVGEDFADHSDRCTGIQKRSHSAGFRIFESDGTPCLDDVT